MKKRLFLIIIIIVLSFNVYSQEEKKEKTVSAHSFTLGFSFAAGGRYDPVRMCVASPKDAEGGPAFEFLALVFEYKINWFLGIGAYIPIGRPILFGAAFKMLQFLPESILSLHIPIIPIMDLLINFGFGTSFHYGPDIHSTLTERGASFFAAGPRISVLVGPEFTLKEKFILIVGAKPYLEYLISENINGAVVGGEIDFQFRYKFTW